LLKGGLKLFVSYQSRGREMEKSVTLEYLRDLANAYEGFIADISKVIPVIRGT
jgi:deoxyadenosine/deoxycytidine kinase